MAKKIAQLAFHILRNPDRALPFWVSFFDLAFLAPGKLVKYSAQVPPDLPGVNRHGTCTPMSHGSNDYDPVTLRSP